jgi:hypothetical protein
MIRNPGSFGSARERAWVCRGEFAMVRAREKAEKALGASGA